MAGTGTRTREARPGRPACPPVGKADTPYIPVPAAGGTAKNGRAHRSGVGAARTQSCGRAPPRHASAAQPPASRVQPERGIERKDDRAATSPRLCQKVVIAVSRGERGALAWRPSRPFSSFPRPVSLLRLGPRIGAPPGRTTGISAFTHARPAGSSEKKNDILLLCIMLGDQESRTRKSGIHLSEKGRYTSSLHGVWLHRVPFHLSYALL
jgi:hypothetical protein